MRSSTSRRAVWWLRRDLRLDDNPALLAAADEGPVLALFVLDDALRSPSGPVRLAFLYRCLRDLDERLSGRLCVRAGRPDEVVPAVAREVGADVVHIAADHGPYGRDRDDRVARALAADGRELRRTGSAYAVAPGRVTSSEGTSYRVFTPFYRAWKEHGWRAPAAGAADPDWLDPRSLPGSGAAIPADPDLEGTRLPAAGEAAARERLRAFLRDSLAGYARHRDEPAAEVTSRLSPYLKWGCVHPRTVLHELHQAVTATSDGRGGSRGESGGGSESPGDLSGAAEKFRSEVAWREFYADVLAAHPSSARSDFSDTLATMAHEPPGDAFEAWKRGRTGYPVVDAGMRQLLAEGWVHNRIRMIEASFVCKDLHVHWTHGARWYLERLVDGDLASNNHGWQWTAGTGTDAAPYFRVFNPVSQGRRFDPEGEYIRRWVPELRGLPAGEVHEPWKRPGGPPDGYPLPVVDHAAERREALDRYEQARKSGGHRGD
ncbi:deoxyribodipyrimidine photolyase [Parafrankia colletiae]|uniref:Deoxyribodipyrimidine photolyase n=1 Tax=Parafrankia colletiae TaxID=573497 RepID=A0A1S1QZA5_9ACTN|nr:deoxyribodipyrimidine photolyase [Parafrankia colletiae]